MKLFGSLKELVAIVWRKNSQEITLRPNQSTTYTANRDIQTPPQDAASILVSENATQTLTNKTISGASNTISNVSLTTGVTGVLPTANGGTGQNSTATFPTSGVVVTEGATETLSNKTLNNTNTVTLKDTLLTVQDDGDATKQMQFQLSGITTGNTRTLTVPDASTTLVGTDATQTLSNKTLASPTITGTATGPTFKATTSMVVEDPGAGTNTVTLQAPTLSGSYTLTLPTDDGNASQVLTTDGSGVLSWSTVATASLNQYNVNVGDSTNTAQPTNTNLLGFTKASYAVFTFNDGNVNTGTDTITVTSHGLLTGDPVYFTNSGGALPTGLTASTRYYAIKTGANTFKVATTLSNAGANTAIDITAASGGGTHSLFTGGLNQTGPTTRTPGSATNDVPAAGYVGEYVSNYNSGTNITSSNTWFNITSYSFPPGHWLVSGMLDFALAGATVQASAGALSVNSGNSTGDHVGGDNQLSTVPPTSNTDTSVTINGYNLHVSEGTTGTLYLKGLNTISAGTPVIRGKIWGIRVS